MKAPEDMQLGAADMDALTRLSEQLEIRSLLKGIEPATAAVQTPRPHRRR